MTSLLTLVLHSYALCPRALKQRNNAKDKVMEMLCKGGSTLNHT